MALETHGRWPLVGAAALGPATALAINEPRVRPMAALLWHQTEEWVWPGGFLPWINQEVLGGDEEFPIDRRTGFAINVLFGWGFSAATFAGSRGVVPLTALYVSHIGNAGLHVGWAVKHRRRDPGVVTAVATLLPVAVTGLRELAKDPRVKRSEMAVGAALGAAIGAGMMPLLKLRLRRRG